MLENPRNINGAKLPPLIYGTAWKEDRTQTLTSLALQQGFRAIDTANQRRHYHEAAVGQAITAALASGSLLRDDLFLQTKYTFRRGQDERLPYDPNAPILVQVEQSFDSSRQHLDVEYIDSFLLHGPTSSKGLATDDWEAWQAIEEIHDRGQTRCIGISNVNSEQLRELYRDARIRPRFVQNRCYAVRRWDHQVRQLCAEYDIIYQAFSLLTANHQILRSPVLSKISARYGRTIPQIIFRFALDIGMIPLTGTSSVEHMREDLAVLDFQLSAEEVQQIETIAAR